MTNKTVCELAVYTLEALEAVGPLSFFSLSESTSNELPWPYLFVCELGKLVW